MEIESTAQDSMKKLKIDTLSVGAMFVLQLIIFLTYYQSGTRPSMTILGLNGFIFLWFHSLSRKMSKNMENINKEQELAGHRVIFGILMWYLLNIALAVTVVILFIWLILL